MTAAVTAARWLWMAWRNRRALSKLLIALGAVVLGGLVAAAVVITAISGAFSPDPEANCAEGGSSPQFASRSPSGAARGDIPGDYLTIYEGAAKEYGIDWAVLGAIGKVESDHGRMSAGCAEGPSTPYGTAKGPMQFIDSTWAASGVDGDGDGVKDVCNPADAIPAAAGYLVAHGAPEDYYKAIFAYNRADWYVQKVLDQADRYRAEEKSASEEQASLLPGSLPGSLPAAATEAGQTLAAIGPLGNPAGNPLANPLSQLPGELSWGMAQAHAVDGGWDLLRGGKELTYVSHTRFEEALRIAVDRWNQLGTIKIRPASGGESPHVSIGDGYVGGAGGTASSAGTITMDPDIMARQSLEYQAALIGHEIGHVIRLGHPPGDWSVMLSPLPQDIAGAWPTDYDKQEYYRIHGQPEEGSSSNGDGGEGAIEGTPVSNEDAGQEPCRTSYTGTPASGEELEKLGSGTGADIIKEAQQYLGVPYVLGGPAECIPGSQMDCSCLTLTVMEKFGVILQDHPMEQWNHGTPVDGEPQAGDLLVWGETVPGTGGHVGFAMGDGRILHANMATNNTAITPMFHDGFMGAKRLVDDSSGGKSS